MNLGLWDILEVTRVQLIWKSATIPIQNNLILSKKFSSHGEQRSPGHEIYGSVHHSNPARFLDGNGQMVPAPTNTKETFVFGTTVCEWFTLDQHCCNAVVNEY